MAPAVTEEEAAAAARRIYERLVATAGRHHLQEQEEDCFQLLQLRLHFRRMPARYMVEMCSMSMVKAEEVVIHRKMLADCADPANRPVVHARLLNTLRPPSSSDFLSLVHIHEIAFGCLDKIKLLTQLSTLVSELGLNIREAHVYSTLDGFSLTVFLVDGWHKQEAGGLLKAIKEAIRSPITIEGGAETTKISTKSTTIDQLEHLVLGESSLEEERSPTKHRALWWNCGESRPTHAAHRRGKEKILMVPPPAPLMKGAEWPEEGIGESLWPPHPMKIWEGGNDLRVKEKDPEELKRRLYERVVESCMSEEELPEEASAFHRHLARLPKRYLVELGVDRADDVLLHWRILTLCAHPDNRPVFHARFQKCITVPVAEFDDNSCQRLMEDLNLERRNMGRAGVGADNTGSMSISSRDRKTILLHEIIFSSLDRPKLLSRLTALLSEIGLNIREAHVYSTTDGLCLDVFVVDGWETEETDDLIAKIKEALSRKNASPSNSTNSSASVKIFELQQQVGDSEIEWNLLKMGKKFATGSFADLSVNHENVLQFYGAFTRPPKYCIVTEYMPGGNLYDFLHRKNNVLDLLTILRIATSISKGMDYLHRNNIIHRDLKTANLLIGYHEVVKIADFGVSRQGNQEGQMTAETGTYRWMAPEVPYDDMTPLQAALGVRQGFRLEIPSSVPPRLSKLMQRCWDEDPEVRPIFAEIVIELENILHHAQANRGGSRRSRAKMQKR
uniref:Protein kinase domain-containing protein n=1 Tax=Leersia perrieri TaxID=77586 RepID=A0A0D9X3F0_9ORYZ